MLADRKSISYSVLRFPPPRDFVGNPSFRQDKSKDPKRHSIAGLRIEWRDQEAKDVVSAYKQLMGLADLGIDANTGGSMSEKGTHMHGSVASPPAPQLCEANKGVEERLAPVCSHQWPQSYEDAQNVTTYSQTTTGLVHSLGASSDNFIFTSCLSFDLFPDTPSPVGASTLSNLKTESLHSSGDLSFSSALSSRPLGSAQTLLLSDLLPEEMTPSGRRHSLPHVEKYPDYPGARRSPMALRIPMVEMESVPCNRIEEGQATSAAASTSSSRSASTPSHRDNMGISKPVFRVLRRPPSYPVRDTWSSRSTSDLNDSTYLDSGTNITEDGSVHHVLIRKRSHASLHTKFQDSGRSSGGDFTGEEPTRSMLLPRGAASPAFSQPSIEPSSDSDSLDDGQGVNQAVYAKIIPVRQGSVTTLKRKQGRYHLRSVESIEDYFSTARGSLSLSESRASEVQDNEPGENESLSGDGGTVKEGDDDRHSDKGDDQTHETSSSNYDSNGLAESPDVLPASTPLPDAITIGPLTSPKHTLRRPAPPLPRDPTVSLTPPRSLNITRVASATPSEGRCSQRSQRSRFEEHLDLDGPSIYHAGVNSSSAISLTEAMAFRCPSLNLSLHVPGSIRSGRSVRSYEHPPLRRSSVLSDAPMRHIAGGQASLDSRACIVKDTEMIEEEGSEESEEQSEQEKARSKLLCQRTLEAGKRNLNAASKKVAKMRFVKKFKGKETAPGPKPALKPDWGPV